MKLEASLKHFSPQGMHISDDVKSTSPNRLNGTDIMTGIGVTSSRARFGLAAFFGKTGISKTDEQLAVQALARHAIDTAPKNVRKAAGKALGRCCLVLAQFAFAEYSRSAETTGICKACNGSGKVQTTIIERKVTYPWGKAPYWAKRSRAVRPSDWEKWTEVTTIVNGKCEACDGKGKVNLIYISPHGHATGSHFMKGWWICFTKARGRLLQNSRRLPVTEAIKAYSGKFLHDRVDFA